MFRKTRQKMKPRVAPRRERVNVLRVRGLLERLEERTMLSASYGSMAYGHGGHDFRPQVSSGSHFGDSSAVASQQQRSVSYDTQTYSSNHEWRNSHREMQGRPLVPTSLQSDPRSPSLDRHWYQDQVWNRAMASSPQPPAMSRSYSEPTYIGMAYTIWEFDTVGTTSKDQETQQIAPTISDGFKAPPLKPPPPDALSAFLDSLNANKSSGNRRLQTTIPSGIEILAVGPTLSDVPFATDLLSRETSTIATVTAIARDVAFQELTTQLFQPNAVSAIDRTYVAGLDADATQSEVVDGFIRPTDASIMEDSANSSDVVAREREAVDAVLEELHDIDLLAPATAPADDNVQVALQSDEALEALPSGAVDGGMVLLQATGDANESNFDLAAVYAQHFEQYDAPAKMETSVGIFQAVDVATDETPVLEVATQTNSNGAAQPEMKLNDNLPTKREKSSSSKAAAIVGATTVTGALVWLTRSSSRIGKSERTTQKRRASSS